MNFFTRFLWVIAIILLMPAMTSAYTTLMRNDPVPIYSTDPYAYLLLESQKDLLYGRGCNEGRDIFTFAISPYYQKASRGRDYDKHRATLGDLQGRWNLLGFLYGNTPTTGVPTELGDALVTAREKVYPTFYATNPPDAQITPPPGNNTDPDEQFGFFSAPIKYRKIGARTEWTLSPFSFFGFTIQAGVTDMKQTITHLVDLDPCVTDAEKKDQSTASCNTAIENRTKLSFDQITAVRCFVLTDSTVKCILKQQGMEPCDYQKTTVEDVNFRIWLRHPFYVNQNQDECEWPHFIITPFITAQATLAVGHKLDRVFTSTCPAPLLSLSSGNDGHHAAGVNGGFLIDFKETLEIGIEGGFMHFFDRDIEYFRIPNDKTQSGIFPFATTVNLQPGRNYHFKATLNAHYFFDRLSATIQYIFVDHSHDEIKLLKTDPTFFPKEVECLSKFTSQMLFTTFNYDISPNIALGFGVEWPLMQRNSYRTTTVIGSLRGIF